MDYKSCKYRYNLDDKLVEECTKIVDGNEMLCIETLNTISSNDYCVSCTPFILLFAVFLATSVIIGGAFVYFYCWHPKKEHNVSRVKFNPNTTHTLTN